MGVSRCCVGIYDAWVLSLIIRVGFLEYSARLIVLVEILVSLASLFALTDSLHTTAALRLS